MKDESKRKKKRKNAERWRDRIAMSMMIMIIKKMIAKIMKVLYFFRMKQQANLLYL